jgi:hypothetical protein
LALGEAIEIQPPAREERPQAQGLHPAKPQ